MNPSSALARETDADDAVPPRLPARRYASRSMMERKQRILAEAQSLLEEAGVEGFTIRELSARADVAQRTLYNIFGSREEIIATAIEQHYAGLFSGPPPLIEPDDFEGVVAWNTPTVEATIRLRRYATAMAGVFFSPGADSRIHDSLERIHRAGAGHWLQRAEEAKVLEPMSDAEREALKSLAVNASYANVADWTAGRIDEDTFRRRSQVNLFLVAFAHLRPRFRAPARAFIARALRGPGES